MTARTRSGYRADDARAVFPIFEETLMRVARMTPDSDRTVARRLRMLADALASMAEHLIGVDSETVAIDRVNADLARILAERKAGERGEP